MCPSYRVTRNEKDVTRGRANTLAAGDLRPARSRRAGLRRDDGHAETLRLLQGLPPRMPDRRRHGQDEDRGAGGAGGQTWPFAARPAGRLSAALCGAGRRASPPLANLRNRSPLLRSAVRKIRRHQRTARPARVGGATCSSRMPKRSGPTGGREVVLFADTFNRAYERENLDAALRVLVEGGYRVHMPRPADHGRPLVLRTNIPLGRTGRSGARRTRPPGRDLCAVCRARRADRRPRAELPVDPARRIAVAAHGRRRQERSARTRCCSRNFWCAKPKPAACNCRWTRRQQGRRAWPLPPEIVRRVQAGRAGASAGSRS